LNKTLDSGEIKHSWKS